MLILVDADACPVKKEVEKVARAKGIKVVMLIDTSHELKSDYSEIITVSKGRDSVDLALINMTSAGDIVITQDYGVATMALAKKAYAISQNGLVFDDSNIDQLLFERHISQKIRRSGRQLTSCKSGKFKKRTVEDNIKFEKCFEKLINEVNL